MAPTDNGKQPASSSDDMPVPQLMLHHAEAATAGVEINRTPTEKRHMGRDVQTSQVETDSGDVNDDPPPPYGEHYGEVSNSQDGFDTNASVGDDGRVNIRINQSNRKLSSLLVPALRQQQAIEEKEHQPLPPPYIPPSLGGDGHDLAPPPMNVVIHVVGSRGDVQPFVALGKVLKDTYGHRVRLATHPVFKDFVRENGLEFFNIGGDPSQLMAFMVKNPGLMPSFDSLRAGDVGNRRREVGEYIKGCWRSCYEAGDGLGPEATDDTIEDWTAHDPTADSGEPDVSSKPFVADCIIANPPSFAHVHVAEKMGIPLHIMFTMPYSPTQAFPHPLANIQSSNADPHLTNYMSYALIDMLTWQGLGDVINKFRQKSLGLEPISLVWAPGMLQRLRIPHTYCWSPALIPKPKDWGQRIEISGFYFLNLASNYTPAPDLKEFLDAGPPPVYIGFGSIVLDDPNEMTKTLFEAVRLTGQRALVSKGWGGMGADELGKPDNVFMLGNVPHDWLFKKVSCVVHHGGAGTTAAGITAGRPTVVVPFFGDQPFWGAMVARAGAGPDPLPHKELTAEKLAEAIKFCLKPESQERAHELAAKIAEERGSDVGAQSFHQFLDVDKLRCNLAPSRAAAWRLKRTQVRLSAMAACTLANEGLLDFNDIKLFRAREYETDDGPWDPVTGGATALIGTMSTMMMGVADMPIDTLKALRIHPATAKKRKSVDADGASGSGETSSTVDDGGKKAPTRSSTEQSTTSQGSTPATSRSNSTFNFQESLARMNSPPLSPGSGARGSISPSMADALRGQLASASRPRSRSGSRPRSRGASTSNASKDPAGDAIGNAIETGKGIRKIVGAGFTSPMDFTMGLATGFHNAPKLYGDDTVRKREQVTDFKSGLRAATKEFGYGMFDGITGLVTQPMRGAQKEGAAGFVKGIGKGIGGIALKPGAAIFGIPGYTMKGVYKEMQKQFGSSVQNYIIAARTAQGFDEWTNSTVEERQDIVRRWKVLEKDLKKKRNPDEVVMDILEEQRRKKQELVERAREGLSDFRPGSRSRTNSAVARNRASSTADSAAPLGSESAMASGPHGASNANELDDDDADLDEAIRRSVQETSRGNADEDAAIERAIQASMAELQRDRTGRGSGGEAPSESTAHGHADITEDEELERALAESLKDQREKHGGWGGGAPEHDDVSDAHLEGTTREDFERQQASGAGEKSQQERKEEEVVMEYVKKQSLLEEQHRRNAGGPSGS